MIWEFGEIFPKNELRAEVLAMLRDFHAPGRAVGGSAVSS